MLSILNIGASAKSHEYYIEYAHAQGEPDGKFWGRGAESFCVEREVISSEQMKNLLRGYSPDGKTALCKNAGDDHRGGWDCTFSAPKSVSVLWSSADESLRQKIESAQARAVEAGLGYIETHGAKVRAGKGGEFSHDASVVVATFEHGSSRAGEPQLHTHAILFNAALSKADGQWRTLESRHVYLMQMAASSFYKAELASQLRSLGFDIERTKNSFEVAGFPKDVCEAQSTRSKEIKARLENAGFDSETASSRSKELAALHTRSPKAELGRDFERWQKENAALGFGVSELRQIQVDATATTLDVEKIVCSASQKLSTDRSTFAFYEFDRAVAESSIGHVGALEIHKILGKAKQGNTVFEVGKGKWGETRYATPEIVEVEKGIMEILSSRTKAQDHLVPNEIVERVLKSRPTLNAEQVAAIEHLTLGMGGIQFVEGQAGTGKSFALGAVREAYEEAGFKLTGLSYTNKAAKNLETSSGIQSRSVDSFLYCLDKNKFELNSKSIVVVDEAAMLDSRKTLRLSELCKDAKAKLIFVGDARQIQPILAGQPFETQKEFATAKELAQVFRQTEAWEREAVKLIREGQVQKALSNFDRKGLLHIAATRKSAREKMIDDWFSHRAKQPHQNALMVVSKNREVDALNESARAKLKTAKFLQSGITLKTAHGDFEFAKNDKIVFTGNQKNIGIHNSVLGTIESVSPTLIKVRTENKTQVTFNPQEFTKFRHGYAITAHKSQGSTVDRSFVLVDGFNMNKELFYVAVSRGRKDNSIYADKTSLREMPIEERKKINRLPEKRKEAAYRKFFIKEIAAITGVSHQKDTTQDYLAGANRFDVIAKNLGVSTLQQKISQSFGKLRDYVGARLDAITARAKGQSSKTQEKIRSPTDKLDRGQ